MNQSTLQGFVRVLAVKDLPDPGKTLVEVGDEVLVLIHAAGNFYALDDVCTHDGGTLVEGQLCGFEIACPRHGAKFDVRTGKALTMPATRATRVHDVLVQNGDVFVKLREH